MEVSTSPEDYPPGYFEQSIGPTLVAISAVFITLDIIFVGLRFYSRRLNNTPWGWDDTLMIPALALNLGTCAVTLRKYSVAAKLQRDAYDCATQKVSTLLASDSIYQQ